VASDPGTLEVAIVADALLGDAVRRGARVLAGGERHAAGRLFFQPTVLADVSADAAIFHQETFGPVAAIAPFDACSSKNSGCFEVAETLGWDSSFPK